MLEIKSEVNSTDPNYSQLFDFFLFFPFPFLKALIIDFLAGLILVAY